MPFTKLRVGDFKSAIDQTISRIKELKAEAEAAGHEFRVIDVGGGRWGKKWDGLITAAVDLVAPDSETDGAVSGIQHFQIDIYDESRWLAQEAELLKNLANEKGLDAIDVLDVPKPKRKTKRKSSFKKKSRNKLRRNKNKKPFKSNPRVHNENYNILENNEGDNIDQKNYNTEEHHKRQHKF